MRKGMEYIFEDNSEHAIPKLFREAYTEEQIKHFHYANGSGNLVPKIIKALNSQLDIVVVFYDLVVDNFDTWELTKKLVYKIKAEETWFNRVMLVPIPCIEYYFIKSIQHTHLVTETECVENCISFAPYTTDKLLLKTVHAKSCNTHERFCKFTVNYAFRNCVKLKVSGKKAVYETQDCPCSERGYHTTNCESKTLKQKSFDMLQCMGIVPTLGENTASIEDIKNIYTKRVEDVLHISKDFEKLGLIDGKNRIYVQGLLLIYWEE